MHVVGVGLIILVLCLAGCATTAPAPRATIERPVFEYSGE